MLPCKEFIDYIEQRFWNAHPGNVAALLTAVCKVDLVEFYPSSIDNHEIMVVCIGGHEYQNVVPTGCADTVTVGCTRLIEEALMHEENWGV